MKSLPALCLLMTLTLPAIAEEAASASEQYKADLTAMREEEKLARDVYNALGELWDLPMYRNIPRSEQRHLDAVGQLLEEAGLDDPIAGLEPGRFASEPFQNLYDQLVQRGSESLMAALQVGALIEEKDIQDLTDVIARTQETGPRVVLRNLRRASGNHLRAFMGQIERRDGQYKPQYLDEETFNGILDNPGYFSEDDARDSGSAASCDRDGGDKGGCGGNCSHGKGEGEGKGEGHGSGCGKCN